MKTWILVLSLLPFSAFASAQVSLGSIRMHMRSASDSDPENFPIRVLSQTFLVSNRTTYSLDLI